jgi:hypothetical protein
MQMCLMVVSVLSLVCLPTEKQNSTLEAALVMARKTCNDGEENHQNLAFVRARCAFKKARESHTLVLRARLQRKAAIA